MSPSGSRAAVVLAGLALLLGACGGSFHAEDLFWTADQQGERLYGAGEYSAAAESFSDPLRKGIALYRAERFAEALDQFARLDSAQAWFARGNALAHLERYEEAVAAYEQALTLQPRFPDAAANLDYLQPFLPLELEGGETGAVGRDAAADEVVFDADADKLAEEGIDTQPEEGGLLSEDQLADMWLQQVDASPAAFLKSKFRYQLEVASGGDRPGGSR